MDSGPYNEKLDETIVMTIAAITKKLKNINEKENYQVYDSQFSIIFR